MLSFHIACLTPINTVPTNAYLAQVQADTNSNAINIISLHGQIYGHLVLTATLTAFIGYRDTAFVTLASPGLNDNMATGITITEGNRQYIIYVVHMKPTTRLIKPSETFSYQQSH